VKNIKINTDTINLDQFLKWAGITETGGEAKALIQEGRVKVNGIMEDRRSHSLKNGDIIQLKGINEEYRVDN